MDKLSSHPEQTKPDMLLRMQEEMYLARLLNGEYGSEEEALHTPDRCVFRIRASHYILLSLSVDDFSGTWLTSSLDSFESLRNTIIPQIRDVFFGFLDGIFENYYCVMDRAMNIVICLPREESSADRAADITVIRNRTMSCIARLREKGIVVSALLSAVCEGAMGVRYAYQQIKQLREYRRILNLNQNFILYAAEDRPKGTVMADRREFDASVAYIDAIRKQNYAIATQELRTLSDELFNKTVMPMNIETLFQYFVHILFISVEEIKKHAPVDLAELLMPEKLFFPAYSVPEILENMEDMLSHLELLRQEGGMEESTPPWYNAVVRYVEDNYTDVTLNVASIADYFSMHPSFLSTSFKSIAHVRLLDYINGLRVKYAKKRILAGDTVTQSALCAGFGSVLTMRRAFLKFEGTLPSKL